MRRLGTIALVAALAALAGLAGCGDNTDSIIPDARPNQDGGVTPDAPPANDFTQFVKNQINTNTSDTAAPVPYGVFSSLPDTDLENPGAYADLFP